MFMGIDIQGKSMSLCDPTSKIKQMQQQQQQLQQGTINGIQKDQQLPNMNVGGNSNSYLNNGSNLQQQAVIQQSSNKQTQMKYNSPLSHQQHHQFKIGHQNKLEYLRQQQALKYNQVYQLDPQLQQQNLMLQQHQYMQNVQMQQQLLYQGNQEGFPPFNQIGNSSAQNSVLLQQYLSNNKGQNSNYNRENGGGNFHSEQSPKSVAGSVVSGTGSNTQFASNILRNSNFIQQQNEFRFQQIQQTHQLLHSLVQQQPLSQQHSNQSSQSSNPQSQSPLPLSISSQQPVISMANYFNQPSQHSNSLFNGQQPAMFNSSENFQQKNILYSCVGNPNNPYNHHINNPYLQEKRYYKSSKLPKIKKENKPQQTFSDIRPSSREKSARFHIAASINTILNQNGSTSIITQNNENMVQTLKGHSYSAVTEKSNIGQQEITVTATSKTQTLIKEHSLTNINSASKENNQVTLASNSNQTSKKTYENLMSADNDEEDKLKCIRYFRYNFGQLLHILGKKEIYFSNLNSKKPIKTFASITQQLGQKHMNLLSKNTINIINKVKKIVATKGKYKYRERFNFLHSAQLKSINYDVRKRLNQIQDKKVLSNTKQKDEEESSDDDETPVKQKSNNQNAVQQTDLAKWKKYNRLDPKTKVFIIKGGYGDLRKALQERGWVENPDYFSPCFDLKWTCKVQDIDYDNLYENQVVNHFDNNQTFTSKYGLARNLRTLIHSENMDVYKFFPRCFDLGDVQEFEDFIENFKVAKAESLVHRFKDMLKNGIESIDEKLELKIRLCNEVASRKFIDFYETIDFIFNYDVLPCVSPEEWEIISKDEYQLDNKKIEFYLERLRSHPTFKHLYYPNNLPQKHHMNKRKNSHRISVNHNHNDPIEEEGAQSSTSLKQDQLQRFSSKSQELLDLCNQTLQKSSEKDPQHHLNGYRNIWIVKPNFLSRGRGIKCFNSLDKIMDYVVGKETQFVVQKYIENPLLINNKKFDMRQWAIVQDFCPPRIWFFEECYIRLCSVEHNIDDLNNRFVHLTNNIVQKYNKEAYTDKDDLMMSQEQFAQYLKETEGRDVFYEEIQPKLKQMVIQSLKSCQDQVGARKNSMEFIGYDFMIDSNYQPWLIEINSSPSMEYSTSLTEELVQRVLQDTTKVIVDYSMAKKGTKKNVDTGGFKLIYKGEKQTKNNKVLASYKK
ncbi:hypothetical protein ABPG72_020979 [Tetrahymena utriculariae]